jgi:hypothetical protein
VLKPAVTSARAKALLEVGRLSGNDAVVLHAPVSRQRAATGIKSATDAYLASP